MIIVLRRLRDSISLLSWRYSHLARIKYPILMPLFSIWKTLRIICRFWTWLTIPSCSQAIRVIKATSIRPFIAWKSLNTSITFWLMIPLGKKLRRIVRISRTPTIRRMLRRTMKMRLQTRFLLRRILIAQIECLISSMQEILMDKSYVNFSNMRTFGLLSKQM